MADAVTVLREEIATLGREVSKCRRALALLTRAATPPKKPAQTSPVIRKPTAPRLAPQQKAGLRTVFSIRD